MGFTEISWLSDMDFESCLNEEKTLMMMMTTPSTLSPIQYFTDTLNMMESQHESPTAFPDQIHLHNNNNSIVASPIILNFENGNNSSSPDIPKTINDSEMELRALNPDEEALVSQVLWSGDNNDNCNMKEKMTCIELKRKRSHVRLPLQNHHHIIAERKRREHLSQKFRALSTMIPGLKKLDKASVLGDTITYLKQLQDKVKALEEEQATKRTVESFVTEIKKSLLSEDDDDEISIIRCEERSLLLPEIKAMVCNNQILIKIQCRRGKGVLVNLLDAMEKHLRLNILSNNATCFGSFVLYVTVVAEVGKDYDLTIEEVVKTLRRVIC